MQSSLESWIFWQRIFLSLPFSNFPKRWHKFHLYSITNQSGKKRFEQNRRLISSFLWTKYKEMSISGFTNLWCDITFPQTHINKFKASLSNKWFGSKIYFKLWCCWYPRYIWLNKCARIWSWCFSRIWKC